MFTRRILAMSVVASLFMAGALMAADATGTWQWSQAGRNGGNPTTVTLKLKQDGEKLTGTIAQPFGGRGGGGGGAAPTSQPAPVEIKDGKVSGSDVTFTMTRSFGGNDVTFKYTLKLDGDTLKGKREADFGGNPVSTDIDAKRVKDEAATQPAK